MVVGPSCCGIYESHWNSTTTWLFLPTTTPMGCFFSFARCRIFTLKVRNGSNDRHDFSDLGWKLSGRREVSWRRKAVEGGVLEASKFASKLAFSLIDVLSKLICGVEHRNHEGRKDPLILDWHFAGTWSYFKKRCVFPCMFRSSIYQTFVLFVYSSHLISRCNVRKLVWTMIFSEKSDPTPQKGAFSGPWGVVSVIIFGYPTILLVVWIPIEIQY